MLMIGTQLTFSKKVEAGRDALNNPTWSTEDITIDDCLIAPISEPTSAREQQAMDQSRVQVRIHLPKADSRDVSGSTVVWDGMTFTVDNDGVAFMTENTPTRWNRYFRAEAVS